MITAKKLRSLGISIPSSIPDNAVARNISDQKPILEVDEQNMSFDVLMNVEFVWQKEQANGIANLTKKITEQNLLEQTPRILKCMVHAPIGVDIVEFEFADNPTQAELFEHIQPLIKKFDLDPHSIMSLNRIVDIHNRVLDFNKIDVGFDRRKIEVIYTVRSFDNLPKNVDYNTYILTKQVAEANPERVVALLQRFEECQCSKDPELNQYAMSLPFVKNLTIL